MHISNISTINFTASKSLTKLWKEGKLPTVTHGLYGGKLTKANCTKEHILPKSKGGHTILGNIALATKQNNNIRSNQPLSYWLTKDMLNAYIRQFEEVHLEELDGPKYIKQIWNTVKKIFATEGKKLS